jgi:hypothetical protein
MLTKSPTNSPVFTGNLTTPSADINGGTIDGTTIGGTTRAAGNFTTVSATGNLTVDTDTLFVDATNNRVGIGTSPAYRADVTGPGTPNGTTLRLNDGASNADSRHLLFTRSSSTAFIGIAGSQISDPMCISRSGGYDLMVSNAGNVGIGTTNPTAKLDVNGTANFNGIVTMPNQPAWQLRPNTNTNEVLSGNQSIVGWSSAGGHILSGGVTLSGSSGLSICSGDTSGRLTVPVSGHYKIWVTMRIENTAATGNIRIFVNGSEKMRQHVEAWSNMPYSHGYISAVLNLSANDYIEIALSPGNDAKVSGLNDVVNWFSGYLIG